MTEKPSLRQKVFYTLGSAGNGVFTGFNHAIVPIWLQNFTGNPYVITYLSNTSKAVAWLLRGPGSPHAREGATGDT